MSPEISECRAESCSAPVRWVKTLAGKKMPLDVEEAPPATGNVYLVAGAEGPIACYTKIDSEHHQKLVAVGARLFTSHFFTCPEADRFRKGGKS